MLDREVVERLGELLAKATPGRWHTKRMHNAVSDWPVVVAETDHLVPVAETFGDKEANAELIAAAHEALPELLRVYRAWLDAPVGLVSPFSDANDRATFLYFNGKGDVQPGKQVRLVRDGDSGEGE